MLYFILRPPLNDRLYASYFKSYDGTTMVRSDKQNAPSEIQSAFNEYNKENYKQSWTMLKSISNSNKANAEAYFFRGISAMEINEMTDAIESFNNVVKNEASLYVDEATWYLALCYLKKDDSVEAITQLSKVVESNSNHKDEAEEIIGKLKK
jgi:tetratricopeptide (TPR) repeat protein